MIFFTREELLKLHWLCNTYGSDLGKDARDMILLKLRRMLDEDGVKFSFEKVHVK